MLDNLVGIIGPGGEGGTFLDWTLHYLSGDSFLKYVLVDRHRQVVLSIVTLHLVSNPITNIGNAHKHKKTHPTEALIKPCIDLVNTINDPRINIHTMYIVASQDSYGEGKSYTDFVRRVTDSENEMKIIQFYHPDKMSFKLADRVYTKITENNSDLETIRSSVLISCNDTNKIIDKPNVYSLNIDDMFYNLDTEIHKIFAWINIPINQDRYINWLSIYKQWQQA